jgi:hypothetical protein
MSCAITTVNAKKSDNMKTGFFIASKHTPELCDQATQRYSFALLSQMIIVISKNAVIVARADI